MKTGPSSLPIASSPPPSPARRVGTQPALASCPRGRYNALQIGEVLPLFAVLRSFWKRHHGPAGWGPRRAGNLGDAALPEGAVGPSGSFSPTNANRANGPFGEIGDPRTASATWKVGW